MTPRSKDELRRVLRAQRRQHTRAAGNAARDALAGGWLDLSSRMELTPRTVAGYLPMPTEPDDTGTLEILHAAGCTVVVPVVVAHRRLQWHLWRPGDETGIADFGIPVPTGSAPGAAGAAANLGEVDVVLVPALAAAPDGVRLGQGGGYYDRALAAVARFAAGGPLRIAVVNDEEVLAAGQIPQESHDAGIDVVLTPRRWLRCLSPAAQEQD